MRKAIALLPLEAVTDPVGTVHKAIEVISDELTEEEKEVLRSVLRPWWGSNFEQNITVAATVICTQTPEPNRTFTAVLRGRTPPLAVHLYLDVVVSVPYLTPDEVAEFYKELPLEKMWPQLA